MIITIAETSAGKRSEVEKPTKAEQQERTIRTTIKQIAEMTGMSLPSVSRILSGKGDAHNSETRKRVRDTASRMGYRVNTSARAVRSGQFDTVALLLGQVGLSVRCQAAC